MCGVAYDFSLTLVGRDIDAGKLITLREKQLKYSLSDELAEELFKRHTRKLVEENISAALSEREQQAAQTSTELDKLLDFNSQLIEFGKHPDSSRFARGLGTIYLLDGDRKTDDMKLLFRRYILDSFSGGRIDKNKLAAVHQLWNIFGICERDAIGIIVDSALHLCDQISADLGAKVIEETYRNPGEAIVKIHGTLVDHFWQGAGVIITDPSTSPEEKMVNLKKLQISMKQLVGLPLEQSEQIARFLVDIVEIIKRKMSPHN